LGAGALGAVGFRGDDGEGWELERDLEGIGVDVSGLRAERGRRTPVYLKPRDLGIRGLEAEHCRYDAKNRSPTPREAEDRVISALDAALRDADALLVMDQVEDDGFGVVTPRVARAVMDAVARRPELVAWADSRRRITSFRGLTLKMNQFELAGIARPGPGDSVDPARFASLIRAAEARAAAPVYVTAGGLGAWIGGAPPSLVPGVRVLGPVDPTGAGDSFSAGAVLALASGATRAEAALMGCLAASVTIRKLGETGTARPAELVEALGRWRDQNL
jgi:sugar/nucleoside kinase (ribokinase family)